MSPNRKETVNLVTFTGHIQGDWKIAPCGKSPRSIAPKILLPGRLSRKKLPPGRLTRKKFAS